MQETEFAKFWKFSHHVLNFDYYMWEIAIVVINW